MAAKNQGRLINLVPGISGVAAGGNAVVNMDVNRRVHSVKLQTQAVNYTAPAIVLKGAGTYNATLTPTVVNGQITVVTITAAGSGMTNGIYTSAGGGVQITDATGIGAQLSVTVASGAVSAVTIVSGGTPGPISPSVALPSLRQYVNGINMRDIQPAFIMAICAARGYLPQYGELPLFYTEPWRNFLRDNELTSWDLTLQKTSQIQFGISSSLVNPGITGVSEFDNRRNQRTIKSANDAKKLGVAVGTKVAILQPVSQHQFTFPINAGLNIINTLPSTFPIEALWFLGSQPGNLYQIEIQADGAKRLEGTAAQISQMYADKGIFIGNTFSAPVAGGGYGNGSPGNTGVTSGTGPASQTPTSVPNGPLSGSAWLAQNGVFPFDMAFIADPDGRPWEALRVASSLIIRIWSNVAQNLTVIQEAYPGGFTA